MRSIWMLAPALLLAAAAVSAGSGADDLVVHEWGTFLSVQGSDGVTLDGMYHEEHALPAFVHSRAKDQLYLPTAVVKGETPVIYFYTPRQRRVNVRVDFPSGIWTQWYPQAGLIGPRLEGGGAPGEQRNGHIEWWAEAHPSPPAGAQLPRSAAGALWDHAREVDAAWVSTSGAVGRPGPPEWERFLFYRGLGQAPLPYEFSAEGGGTLRAAGADGATHLFVLRVEKGRAAYRYLPRLDPGESLAGLIPSLKKAIPVEQFSQKVGDELADRLTEAGLYPKEARAMVNTWRGSYLKSEGTRVLCVLPQAWTDRFIPMQVSPKPKELVRVMVGRLELLTPERERVAESAVRDLAAADARTREKAFETLRAQGRYAEPVLRRVLKTSRDASVRTLCRRLLLTDFVTELRSAVNDATTGERRPLGKDLWFARAQLAALLREVGLEGEAKAEGRRVLDVLNRMNLPREDESAARHHLRAYARAMEGVGDDAGAAEWYGKFIRFGSLVKTRRGCTGCHRAFETEGPTSMAFFRDWWAGRRYAAALQRQGRAGDAVRRHEATLKTRPGDPAAQLALAYLYAAQGESDRAERLWTALAPEKKEVAERR